MIFKGGSVWEKRETSLCMEDVNEIEHHMSNCEEMKWLSAFSLFI